MQMVYCLLIGKDSGFHESGLEGSEVICLYSMFSPSYATCLFLAPYAISNTVSPLEVNTLFWGH